AEYADQLRVVMPGQRDALLSRAWNRGDEVHHVNLTDGRFGVERLGHRGNAERLELVGDVRARAFDGRRPSRPRPDAHDLPEMLVRARAVKGDSCGRLRGSARR